MKISKNYLTYKNNNRSKKPRVLKWTEVFCYSSKTFLNLIYEKSKKKHLETNLFLFIFLVTEIIKSSDENQSTDNIT